MVQCDNKNCTFVGRGHDPADQVTTIALVKNDGHRTSLRCVGAVMTPPYEMIVTLSNTSPSVKPEGDVFVDQET